MSAVLSLNGFSSSRIPCTQSAGSSTRRSFARKVAIADAAAAAAGRAASPYEVLRVSRTASAAEIKAAYRALAKRFHPDVAPAGDGSDFLEIQRAYATLSDPDARGRYDRSDRRVGFSGSVRFGTRRWETDQCW